MLPQEYTRLKCVEFTGAQYINTGFTPNGKSRITMDCALTDVSANACFFCARSQATNLVDDTNSLFCLVSYYRFDYYGKSLQTGSVYGANQRLSIDSNQSTCSVNDYTVTTATVSTESPMPWILGASAMWSNNTITNFANYAKMKLYACKMYDDGVLTCEFVPAQSASGEVGIYDLLHGTFHADAAGGAFASGAAIIPSAPANLAQTISGSAVTLTWTAADEYANHYKIFSDGTEIADVDGDTFTYTADIGDAAGTVAFDVAAYNGTQASAAASVSIDIPFEMSELITDREAADVAEAKRLIAKVCAGETLTDEESAAYFVGLRGCYNASDMNRVGAAAKYIASRLRAAGYTADVSLKTAWRKSDIVRKVNWRVYLNAVKLLRSKLTLMPTTPGITDAMYNGIDYKSANDIEQILIDLDQMLTNIVKNQYYAGEIFAGEV